MPGRMRMLRGGLPLILCMLSATGASAQEQQAPSDLESTRPTLEKWVEARRTISKEKREWTLAREVLNDRIQVVQREIDALKAKIAEAQKSAEEADQKKAELVVENDKAKSIASSLESIVAQLESRTKDLLKRLPEIVTEKVRVLSQRIPEDAATTKAGLAERFQNVVGILNEVNKFHREVVTNSELRVLADGSSAQVTAVYLGIGQGFYSSANGSAAGIGKATPSGWVWTPAAESAAEIARMVSILKNESVASFVRLPMKVE